MSSQEDRAAASLAAIEAGGLPLAAQERLEQVRARGGRFFTSDLSVNEFLLVQEAGFRPQTQVMGSCFYQLGYQWLPGSAYAFGYGSPTAGETLELETQTEAWNEARELALGRLAEEARRAGADAVVGVRLTRGEFDWAAGLIEFVVTGTAVTSTRYDLAAGGAGPMLSNLSGQDFAKLFRHGYWPVGLVAGSTVCYVVTGWTQQASVGAGIFASRQNQELPDFTRGLYDTRAQAMHRLTRKAHELGAHGVVGVQIEHREHEQEAERGNTTFRDLLVTMHVLGTAIVELDRRDEEPPVYVALSLDQESQ